MYKAVIIDRLQTIPTRKTKQYESYKEAHEAGQRLAKKHFTENRYQIHVQKKYNIDIDLTTSDELLN